MEKKSKTPSKHHESVPKKADAKGDVDAFLASVAATPRRGGGMGRVLFAMDATASREPTWDMASHTQAEMFKVTEDLGGLAIQLAFYRGFGEFKVSPWLQDTETMLSMMTAVFCLAGQTQIHKVLKHVANEARSGQVHALVFVGDVIEEDIDALGHLAGELGLLGVPAFVFQEGHDGASEKGFRQIAKLSGGAYGRFDTDSPHILRDLLSAVAVFAAGGRKALENHARKQGGEVLMIAKQMKG